MNKLDLEERLIAFSVLIIEITDNLPNGKAANHLAGQLIRSGTSVSLNYGEAQSGESRKDFIHKIKVVLKELRESYICMKIIKCSKLFNSEKKIKYSIARRQRADINFCKKCRNSTKKLKSINS